MSNVVTGSASGTAQEYVAFKVEQHGIDLIPESERKMKPGGLFWLWAGGLLLGVGGVLALVPGSRRRATDPASASSPLVTDAQPGTLRDREAAAPEPVGALAARGTGPA